VLPLNTRAHAFVDSGLRRCVNILSLAGQTQIARAPCICDFYLFGLPCETLISGPLDRHCIATSCRWSILCIVPSYRLVSRCLVTNHCWSIWE
jgi:hypothetical protein